MTLLDTESAVRAFYADRLTNDPELIMSWLSSDGHLELNGVSNTPILRSASGADAQEYFAEILLRVHYRKIDLQSIIVQGQEAATQAIVTVEDTENGKTVTSPLSDHFVWDGQRFSKIITYCDTWLLHKTVGIL